MATSAARQAQKRWTTRAQRRRLQEFLRFWHAGQGQIDERKRIRELRSMLRLWKAGRLVTFYGDPKVYVNCKNCDSGRLWQNHRAPHGCEDCVIQDCPL